MSLLRRLFAIGALAILPAIAGAQAKKLSVPFVLDTLPNGLTLIVHEDHSTPVVTTNVWFQSALGTKRRGAPALPTCLST